MISFSTSGTATDASLAPISSASANSTRPRNSHKYGNRRLIERRLGSPSGGGALCE
jgi:hypothetical protein